MLATHVFHRVLAKFNLQLFQSNNNNLQSPLDKLDLHLPLLIFALIPFHMLSAHVFPQVLAIFDPLHIQSITCTFALIQSLFIFD